MSKNVCASEMPDPEKIFKNLTSAFEISKKLNKSFAVANQLSGMYTAITEYQSVLRKIYSMHTPETIIKNITTVQSIFANVKIPTAVDWVATMEKVFPIIDDKWKAPTIDWNWVSKTLDTYDDYERESVAELLTDDIRVEMDESIQETLATNISFKSIEQRYGEWKERHPLLADLYLQLIGFILGILGGVIASFIPATTNKNTNVYEAPTTTSNVVININIDQNVTVINEVPYYYEIIYTHPETGEEITGYIYKPSVSILQDSNETSDIETENSNIQ